VLSYKRKPTSVACPSFPFPLYATTCSLSFLIEESHFLSHNPSLSATRRSPAAVLVLSSTRLLRAVLVLSSTRLLRAVLVLSSTRLLRAVLVLSSTRLLRASLVLSSTRFLRADRRVLLLEVQLALPLHFVASPPALLVAESRNHS
jgi:hypothetical protein